MSDTGPSRPSCMKIASELWLLWQLIGPIDLQWEDAFEQRSFFIFCWIFMKLADNNNVHKISDEFENGSDWTNSGRVTLIVRDGHYRPCEQRIFFIFFLDLHETCRYQSGCRG